MPAALAPDTPWDVGGCFSGSAVELSDGKQLLMYTGLRRPVNEEEAAEAAVEEDAAEAASEAPAEEEKITTENAVIGICFAHSATGDNEYLYRALQDELVMRGFSAGNIMAQEMTDRSSRQES